METGFMMENWFAQLAHSSAQTAQQKEENLRLLKNIDLKAWLEEHRLKNMD